MKRENILQQVRTCWRYYTLCSTTVKKNIPRHFKIIASNLENKCRNFLQSVDKINRSANIIIANEKVDLDFHNTDFACSKSAALVRRSCLSIRKYFEKKQQMNMISAFFLARRNLPHVFKKLLSFAMKQKQIKHSIHHETHNRLRRCFIYLRKFVKKRTKHRKLKEKNKFHCDIPDASIASIETIRLEIYNCMNSFLSYTSSEAIDKEMDDSREKQLRRFRYCSSKFKKLRAKSRKKPNH